MPSGHELERGSGASRCLPGRSGDHQAWATDPDGDDLLMLLYFYCIEAKHGGSCFAGFGEVYRDS